MIHIVCIPLIIFSATGMLQFWGFGFGDSNSPIFLNGALILVLLLGVLYLNVDVVSGAITTALNVLMAVTARIWYLEAQQTGTLSRYFNIALTVHILAWAAQIVGHKLFESKRCNLTDREEPCLHGQHPFVSGGA